MGRLEGKVAIVTGAGSGIGEASARLMAHEGAAVVVADINETQAQRVAGEIGCVAAQVDVSDESSVVRMIDRAVEVYDGLDVLHNNATDSSTNAADTNVVVFLASDEAAYVNGTTVMADGGATVYMPSTSVGRGGAGAT